MRSSSQPAAWSLGSMSLARVSASLYKSKPTPRGVSSGPPSPRAGDRGPVLGPELVHLLGRGEVTSLRLAESGFYIRYLPPLDRDQAPDGLLQHGITGAPCGPG